MRWSYDLSHDVLYVQFSDEPVASSRELEDGSVADVDASGGLVGVEVLFGLRTWEWPALAKTFPLTADQAASLALLTLSPLLWGSGGPRSGEATVVLPEGGTTSPAIELELTPA